MKCPSLLLRLGVIVSLVGLFLAGCGVGTSAEVRSIASSNLHNAFFVTPKILSGSSPDNEAGFAELASFGVKTIISVDGSKPDVEMAKKFGMRYVHLPIGYDGIPTNRVVELVKAAQTLEGPFYVHCHHGKHRGPAAVAVMCEAVAGWSTNVADQWLKRAGTSPDYPGLYRNVREFKRPSAGELAAVKSFPEIARTSSLVEAMVAIDEHFDRLKGAQKRSWKNAPDHPDIQPAHEATLLWEQFREMARLSAQEKHPADFAAKVADAAKLSDQFRALLKESPADTAQADGMFKKIGESCSACHKAFRN